MTAQLPETPTSLRPGNLTTERRQQTATSTRPMGLQQNRSNAPSIGRFETTRLGPSNQSRPLHARSSTVTTGMGRMHPVQTARTDQSTRANINREPHRRPEKQQRETVDIENDYFKLNPWYNEQRQRPVFGLGAPLPRTVRRGMLWGRGDLRKSSYRADEEQDGDGIVRQDGLEFDEGKGMDGDSEDSEVTLHGGRLANNEHDPARLQTTTDGRDVQMRNVPTSEANEELHDRNHNHTQSRDQIEHESRQHAPVNEHGLDFSGQHGQTQHFGLQDGLPPLQELDSNASSGTQKEKKEMEQREQEAERQFYDQYRNPIARLRAKFPQAPAEFLATFVYLLVGLCVNLSVTTSQQGTGSFETQAWGWGFAVMIGIYLGGGVSGSHLSPTISISLAIYRGFPWKLAIVYIFMQLLAGLCAGAVAYALYHDAIHAVDPNLTLNMTGQALFPKGPVYTTATGFFNDFIYMAIFVCVIFALGDDQNSPPGQGMTALIVGLTAFVTMIGLGYNTGLGISPARDLGPRLVAWWVGYDDAFANEYWAYGSWGASIGGALVGGLMYDLCIFVGGESPVNYRWPQPSGLKWKAREKTTRKKRASEEQIQSIA
ncbi:aquaporin-like protein [Decorospora gaudefroyi]|uniref:Aquaporin-like protein n=1 Tax=Decorospora gaudefroyi TaxID=184978 RepID=A0A6A5KF24_9PLEO|nr:aquaporin-like protein [Decorospora gaudefroyi]